MKFRVYFIKKNNKILISVNQGLKLTQMVIELNTISFYTCANI